MTALSQTEATSPCQQRQQRPRQSYSYFSRACTPISSGRMINRVVAMKAVDELELQREAPPLSLQMTMAPTTVALSSAPKRLAPAGGDQIRSRLLNRLGIEKGGEIAANSKSRAEQACRVLEEGKHGVFNEALKADYGEPDRRLRRKMDCIDSLSTSPGQDSVLAKQAAAAVSSGVCFDASVKVHPIPSRADYSKRVHNVLWTPSTEMAENAARNTLEFAAECWDPTKVVDDEDMVVCGSERIHPIHFVQECNLNRHFCNVMAHQQQQTQD